MDKHTKIYVAGHTGLVGTAVVKMLKKAKYDNIITATHADLDLLKKTKVLKFLKLYKPDVVIMCAARVGGIGANSKDNAGFLYDNITMNNNLIMAAKEVGVKKFVFLGSSCIYPKYARQPIEEESLLSDVLEPTNEGYALAKITGIKLCQFITKQNPGYCYYSLMPCNLYGYGDNYHPYNSHVLPAMIRKFVEAKQKGYSYVSLWGDGSPLREFLHADDLGRAVVMSLDIENPPYLMNVGSGRELSIKELAKLVKACVRYDGNIVWDTTKPNGTPRKVMDSHLFFTLTKWTPKIAMVDGVLNAIKDYKKNWIRK